MKDDWTQWIGPGERLLWQGAPVRTTPPIGPLIAQGMYGLPFMVFGLTILGITFVILELSNRGIIDALINTVFGLPVLILGTMPIALPLLRGWLAPHRVRYALTDEAAYIATQWWRHRMTRIVIDADDLSFTPGRSNRPGSIWLGIRVAFVHDGTKPIERIGFENIADGAEVYRLALEATGPDG